MPNGNGQSAGKTWLEDYPDRRNKYFYGQLVTAHDLHNAQDYLLERIKALSLLLNGPGVVYGLDVMNVRCGNMWPDITVDLGAGFAVDGLGRHIVVPSDVEAEEVLFEGAKGTPIKKPQEDDVVIFYLEREECRTGKIPSYGGPSPCGQSCCYSRVKESYRVTGRVLKADGFTGVLKLIEDYYRKVDHDLLGIEGDAGIYDVLKLIPRYADKYQPSISAFLGKLHELCRVYEKNGRGGVAIWAARYGSFSGTIEKNEKYEDPNDLDADTLVNLFRRHILSNDTLAQMIAEHAADYDNPHRLPKSDIIHGKYTLQGTLAKVKAEEKWTEYVVKVGPLVYADGRPVTSIVTSVSVGWSINFKPTEDYHKFVDDFGYCTEFGHETGPLFEKVIEDRHPRRYGYYNETFTESNLSGGDGPSRTPSESPEIELEDIPSWISLVPIIPHVEGGEQPTLLISVTETLSRILKERNKNFIIKIADDVGEKCGGTVAEKEGNKAKFLEDYGGLDFVDMDIIIYWSAAVTEQLDMVKVVNAALIQEILELPEVSLEYLTVWPG
jgi:hypothetical protein